MLFTLPAYICLFTVFPECSRVITQALPSPFLMMLGSSSARTVVFSFSFSIGELLVHSVLLFWVMGIIWLITAFHISYGSKVFTCLKINFIFYSSLRFTAKLNWNYTEVVSPHRYRMPNCHQPHQSIFISADEPTLTHHCHQRLEMTSGFPLGSVHSMGLDKCIMSQIHHCGAIQSNSLP